MDKTVASVPAGKHHTKIFYHSTLEVYKKTPIFIPAEITQDVVKQVTRKLLGSLGPGGTDSEALQRWLKIFKEDSKNIRTSVEILVNWLDNQSPTWAAYREFISGCLIALYKQSGVLPVGIGETWRFVFPNFLLKVTGPNTTNTFQYDHLCSGLKAVIDGTVHGDQDIGDANSSTENWGFLLAD